MIRENRENLLGVHCSRMLAGKSGFEGREYEQFAGIIVTLFNCLNEGHSCLPLGKSEEELLHKTELVSTGQTTPLVVYNHRLYLHRYFNYEMRLARQIGALAEREIEQPSDCSLFDQLFGCEGGDENLQKKAAELSICKPLAIISGGPGTGKTTTVVHIITLLLQLFGNRLKIALAAPTGKAAMRLRESVQKSVASLTVQDEIIQAIPDTAQTLHRLLGVKRNSPQFRHNNENPLTYDVVIVDEASMVDLALMSKLLDALHPRARLILLGDKDQLSSVESGAVLAEFTDSLVDNTVVLAKSYRFNAVIRDLAEAIKNNSPQRAWQLLEDKNAKNVHRCGAELENLIIHGYDRFRQYIETQGPELSARLFKEFNRFRILCAIRGGRRGVENINGLIEQRVMSVNGFSDKWYPGKPVMINRNDYSLGLFNGDIGICLEDKDDGGMKVWFENEDGSLRSFLPYRLPAYSVAYALTIHKSQGSEFDDVVIILPEEDTPVLSRELIYTAVTRAKNSVWISAEQDIFHTAVSRKTVRFSGLGMMIRER